ncbi:hypothetical protein ACFLTN_04720 [Chloroflexota bacterium]
MLNWRIWLASLGFRLSFVQVPAQNGDEKPLKHPLIFNESALLLINKIDLLKYTNFNLKGAKANARRVNPDLDIIEMSCTAGEGISDWISWLHQRYQKKFGTKSRHKMFDY